jgi:hypothetical protein
MAVAAAVAVLITTDLWFPLINIPAPLLAVMVAVELVKQQEQPTEAVAAVVKKDLLLTTVLMGTLVRQVVLE